jgi:MFS family permease
VVFLLSQLCYTGYLFIMPEFLQQARGDSALSSGLTTLPGAIGLWLNAQLAARVYPRSGPRRMALAGAAGVAVILCTFGLVLDTSTNTWLIRVLAFCSGSSIGWINIAVQAASFSTISSADTGRASALFNTGSRMAGGVGLAVLVTVVTASGHGQTGGALVPAYHLAFLTAAALIVTAGLAALLIRDSDAAASMLARARRGAPRPAEAAAEGDPESIDADAIEADAIEAEVEAEAAEADAASVDAASARAEAPRPADTAAAEAAEQRPPRRPAT